MLLLFSACGVHRKLDCYTPQPTSGWDKIGSHYFHLTCGVGEITIYPIVLNTRETAQGCCWIQIPFEKEKVIDNEPYFYIKIKYKPRITTCSTSFISLQDKSTGKQIKPERVKTHTYNDDHFPQQQTDCMFSFNLRKDVSATYELHISEELLGCRIEPITYIFEETMMYIPALMP